MTPEILVVGALHLDVIVEAPRLPRTDETLMGSGVRYAFGGKGGNQAVAAVRMGARVAMAGRVGADGFGDRLLEELDAAGVDRALVRRDDGASGLSVAIVDAAGDYGAVVVSAANMRIEPAEVAIPRGVRLVMLQNEVPEAVNVALAKAAAQRGIPVIWNAAPYRRFADTMPALCRYLVVNRVEARDMTGTAGPMDAARLLRGRGFGTVILTLGGDGLVCCTAEICRSLDAREVAAISTHGAGDAFCGAIAARLVAGEPLVDALDFAQAAAALHVSTPVAERATLDRGAVDAFLQSR